MQNQSMTSRLNFFEPYESIPAYYENQLTRALLVILRYSPLAHSAWLRAIDSALRLERLPGANFRTQQARALRTAPLEGEEETIRGISVLLTPGEEKVRRTVSARPNGGQILDGLIEYGNALLVVVENKLFAGQGHRQASQISVGDARVVFDASVRTVRWQELLESFADIAASGLASGAELHVIEDFLSFVEHHFSQLGPYSSLRRAGIHNQRIKRRLDAILAEILDSSELTGQGLGWRNLPERPNGGHGAVKMVQLAASKDLASVRLTLYPGDTLTQSKVLYRRPEAIRGLLTLPGWSISTNYHWGFMEAGLWWPRGPITTRDYVEYWITHIGNAGKIPRDTWQIEWQRLEAVGMATPADRSSFDAKFTQKNFTTATPKPGLRCDYSWPMANATTLDDSDRLVAAVRDRLVELLEQIGEHHLAIAISGFATLPEHA